ncbi:hypothetical protein D3C80_1341360 [compost metagenome]
MHLDPLPGQIGDDAGARGALVQDVAGQLHHVRLEAPRQKAGAVLDRGDEADLAEDAARLERLQPIPQGAALGAGQIGGALHQDGVATRQAHALQRAAGARLDPVQAVGQRHGAHGDAEGRREGPGLTQQTLDVALGPGRDQTDACVARCLQQMAHGVLPLTGRQRAGPFGLCHHSDGEPVGRRRRNSESHDVDIQRQSLREID